MSRKTFISLQVNVYLGDISYTFVKGNYKTVLKDNIRDDLKITWCLPSVRCDLIGLRGLGMGLYSWRTEHPTGGHFVVYQLSPCCPLLRQETIRILIKFYEKWEPSAPLIYQVTLSLSVKTTNIVLKLDILK